jgi:divalent metal cation (Fe/Co/Zn/Cd) transporter
MQHGPGDALRGMRIRRFLIVILIANITVVVAKLVIGLTIESVAVPGDTAHSSVDVMNNLLGLAVIRIASQEPDENPPYRQQKVETLGAFASVAFLSASPIELAKGANTRAAVGGPGLSVSVCQITILAGTLVVNGGVLPGRTLCGAHATNRAQSHVEDAHQIAECGWVYCGPSCNYARSYYTASHVE